MAERSLFFNALPDPTSETGYDRNYNADDMSDWLAMSCETGVVKDGLKVVASSGLNINLSVGRAAINGKGYINDAVKSFTISTNGTSAKRYDYIVLRFNKNIDVRDITSELVVGSSNIPTVANLTRNDNVYELMLAYIEVGVGASNITQTNIVDTRGDKELCPWFTAVKGYADYYDAIIQRHEYSETLDTLTTTIITDLPSNLVNSKYSLIEVFTNGLKEPQTAYTVNLDSGYIVINFVTQKIAGANITVKLDNFLDGEGMETVFGQYTQLLENVAALTTANEFNYVCNGVNDNVYLSKIAEALLNGEDYSSKVIRVYGKFGATAPYSGVGDTVSPYVWLVVGASGKRRVVFDFNSCDAINLPITAGTHNTIFGGENAHIISANVVAEQNGLNTIIQGFSENAVNILAENCKFKIDAYKSAWISRTGTFNNCRGEVSNLTSFSMCFYVGTSGLLRVNGGEYYAYTTDSTTYNAVVVQSGQNAISILNGLNAPVVAKSGYYQTNSLYQFSDGGVMNSANLISTLPVEAQNNSDIRGTILINKPNTM